MKSTLGDFAGTRVSVSLLIIVALTLNSRAMSHVDADGQAGRLRSVTARACSSSSLQRKRCRAVYAGIQLWAIVHTVCHFALSGCMHMHCSAGEIDQVFRQVLR